MSNRPTAKQDQLRKMREDAFDANQAKTKEAVKALKAKVAEIPVKKRPKAKP